MVKQKMTIEDLALMVKRGFDDTTSRMATKQDLAELRKEFHERMSIMEDDIHDIKIALGPLVRVVAALESDVQHLNMRVNRLERKMGLAK